MNKKHFKYTLIAVIIITTINFVFITYLIPIPTQSRTTNLDSLWAPTYFAGILDTNTGEQQSEIIIKNVLQTTTPVTPDNDPNSLFNNEYLMLQSQFEHNLHFTSLTALKREILLNFGFGPQLSWQTIPLYHITLFNSPNMTNTYPDNLFYFEWLGLSLSNITKTNPNGNTNDNGITQHNILYGYSTFAQEIFSRFYTEVYNYLMAQGININKIPFFLENGEQPPLPAVDLYLSNENLENQTQLKVNLMYKNVVLPFQSEIPLRISNLPIQDLILSLPINFDVLLFFKDIQINWTFIYYNTPRGSYFQLQPHITYGPIEFIAIMNDTPVPTVQWTTTYTISNLTITILQTPYTIQSFSIYFNDDARLRLLQNQTFSLQNLFATGSFLGTKANEIKPITLFLDQQTFSNQRENQSILIKKTATFSPINSTSEEGEIKIPAAGNKWALKKVLPINSNSTLKNEILIPQLLFSSTTNQLPASFLNFYTKQVLKSGVNVLLPYFTNHIVNNEFTTKYSLNISNPQTILEKSLHTSSIPYFFWEIPNWEGYPLQSTFNIYFFLAQYGKYSRPTHIPLSKVSPSFTLLVTIISLSTLIVIIIPRRTSAKRFYVRKTNFHQ